MALERMNGREMRLLGVSRRQLFETIERPVMQDLPERDYEFAEWHFPRVGIDYHVGLDGMAKGFRDLAANPEGRALEHAEWLGLWVDQEVTLRAPKRFEARTRTAKLRQAATAEDVDFRNPRGLDRTLFLHLASCDRFREHRHCLITGACGTGKSFIACALGDRACRENLSVLYQRSSGLSARWPWRAAVRLEIAQRGQFRTDGFRPRCAP